MFGGTPSNPDDLPETDRLEVITGVNLPMLICSPSASIVRPPLVAKRWDHEPQWAIWVASDLLRSALVQCLIDAH